MLKYFFFSFLIAFQAGAQQGFDFVKEKRIISPDGKPMLLGGINLGSRLVPEGYMFKFENAASLRLVNNLFLELIDPKETGKFWKNYRDNYILIREARPEINRVKKLYTISWKTVNSRAVK